MMNKLFKKLFAKKITLEEHEKQITTITVIRDSEISRVESTLKATINLLIKDKENLIKENKELITKLITRELPNYDNYSNHNLSPLQTILWKIYNEEDIKTESEIIERYNKIKPITSANMDKNSFRKNKSIMKNKNWRMELI